MTDRSFDSTGVAPRRRRLRRVIPASAAGALLFTGIGTVIGQQAFSSADPAAETVAAAADAAPVPSAASIAQAVSPGLVDVNTVIDYGTARGAATGIVLSANGEVLTNNHVVEGATSIRVTDIGNHKTYSASVVGYDMSKDIAVIQLKGASGLPTAKIGNSATVAVGQPVVAIGNANGVGGNPSYAAGTITSTNRSLTASDSFTGSSEQLSGMLATDANIVAGDSGGPLVDQSGAVIGVDTAGSTTFQFAGTTGTSQGFAVPINTAMRVTHQIEAKKPSATVHIGPTAFLGVSVTSTAAAGYGGLPGYGSGFGGLPGYGSGYGSGSAAQSGVLITGIVANSPAARAGLAAGDVITAVGGHPVTTTTSLTEVMVRYEKPAHPAAVSYVDGTGTAQTVTVTFASGPAQ